MEVKVYKGFDVFKNRKELIKYTFVDLKEKFMQGSFTKKGLTDLIGFILEEKINIDYETHFYLQEMGAYNFYDFSVEIIYNNMYLTRYPLGDYKKPKNLYNKLEVENEDIDFYSEIIRVNDIYFASYKPTTVEYIEKPFYHFNSINLSTTNIINPDAIYIDNIYDLEYLSYLLESESTKNKSLDYKVTAGVIPEQLALFVNIYGINVSLIDEGVIFLSPREELRSLLKDTYGYDEYRSFSVYASPEDSMELVSVSQDMIIEDIIQQSEMAISNFKESDVTDRPKNLFITAPTGTGKSLMFIIPALYISRKYPEYITIVITPIKSLMQDQVENYLRDTGLSNSAFINGDLSIIERKTVIERIDNSEVDILYLSPELLISKSDITDIIGSRKIGLLVIDEAHIVTSWGQGFRPDYWYLGEYLWKLKSASYNDDIPDFPIVAFTATAVYSPYSVEGMVEDICNSLKIIGAKKYLGKAVREDISYDITSRALKDVKERTADEHLYKETVQFIQDAIVSKTKSLVYVPYKKHSSKIYEMMLDIDISNKDIIGVYTSDGDKYVKRELIRDYKSGKKIVIIATKAFGMGVDINDIKNVYHFAPTGTLCDYVQEVGRAARKKNLQGTGTIKYLNNMMSLKYDNQLFGMSSIKMFEIFAVMKKIVFYYEKKKKQNMVISIKDFAAAFDPEFMEGYDESQIESKIKTILMMIKKHYEHTITSFPVIMARPSSMFTKQYFRILDAHSCEKHIFSKYLSEVESNVYALDLKMVWEKYYSEYSFGKFKRMLLSEYPDKDSDESLLMFRRCVERYVFLEIEINIDNLSIDDVINLVVSDFDFIYGLFSACKVNKETTTLDEVYKQINEKYNDSIRSELITNNIPAIINGLLSVEKTFDSQPKPVSYIQSKKAYRVVYSSLEKAFINLNNISKKMKVLMSSNNRRYVSNEDLERIQPILTLMDLMGYGTYYTTGGDSPEIQIRLNGVRQFRNSIRTRERNLLHKKVEERQKASRETFEYFFNELKSDSERQIFLEYYFVGKTQDCKILITDKREGRITNVSIGDILTHLTYGSSEVVNITDDRSRLTLQTKFGVKKVQNQEKFFIL